MAAPVLTTTRYVEIGTYIGQFYLAGAGNLPNDVRVPCLVGKGDRTVVIRNLSLRRAFLYNIPVTFSATTPFLANFTDASDGSQLAPVRLFTSDGTVVSTNKWQWISVGGSYTRIQILDSAYDPTAQYYMDYQSTERSVLDVIPQITLNNISASAQIREFMSVGTVPDLDEFQEYSDFYGSFEIDAVEMDTGNSHTTTGFSVVTDDSANTGTGTVALNSGANYSHNYDRLYTFEVTSATGTSPNRLATIAWSATPMSYGNSALPATPLNPAQARSVFNLDEANPLTLTAQLAELGVIMDFTFGATHFVAGDKFYVQGRGPGLVELDPKLSNTNQFTTFSAVTPTLQPLSTGSATLASSPTDYAITEHNMKVRLQVINVTGTVGAGNRTATFVWSGYGTTLYSGTFTVSQLIPASLTQALGATGLQLTFAFGATHFVVADRFDFTVSAPRIFYKGKEAVRNITFTVSAVDNSVANVGSITGGYLTDTAEGRYGTWEADSSVNQGRFEINDGLRYYVRNTFLSTLVNATPSGSRLAVSDKFTEQLRFLGTVDFSLMTQATEVLANPAQIATDIGGTITGTVGAKYIMADHIPSEILSLTRVTAMTNVAYSWVSGTNILVITETPFGTGDGDLQLVYRHRGGEPTPGQDYYVSAKFLRPDEFYNTPVLFLGPTDAEQFLAPSTTKNDLYIAAQIAWDYPIAGLFCIQVKDGDDDGVFSRDDYKTAINTYLQDKRATDLVVLNHFSSLPDQLQVINKASDPFELHESLTWIGCPIGTPIGSEQQVDSLVFLSAKSLAVYGQNPAHGTRILVGPTRATKTITLEDKSSAVVTLDGSFVAVALAALCASFFNPTQTILLRNIVSFDTIQTYRPEENLILGGAQIIYLKDLGSSIYAIYEDVTTDRFSPDVKNINMMTQKQFVTRDIRRTINEAIIGSVFPSAQVGADSLQSILVSRLAYLESGGFIGRYQDDTGEERGIDADADTLVFRDTVDPTLFHIGYNYFLATVVKKVFGLYTVNLASGFPR